MFSFSKYFREYILIIFSPPLTPPKSFLFLYPSIFIFFLSLNEKPTLMLEICLRG